MIKPILQGKVLGHPLHPLLIHFPIALFSLALVLDISSYVRDDGHAMQKAAHVAIIAGIITALIASGPGFVDWPPCGGCGATPTTRRCSRSSSRCSRLPC
jgi:hypothetical protein